MLYRPSNSASNSAQPSAACAGHNSIAQLKASAPVSDREFRLLNVRVPTDIAQRLKERAARDYESQASLVRRLIRQGLNTDLEGEVAGER